MDENEREEFEGFTLEDILNEFHTEPEAPVSSDTGSIPSADTHPHVAVNLEDTGPMAPISSSRDLFTQESPDADPVPEASSPAPAQEAEAAAEGIPEAAEAPEAQVAEANAPAEPSEPAPEASVETEEPDTDDTKDFSADALLDSPAEETPDSEEDTRRFTPTEEETIPTPPPIPFTSPRSRLRELKKQLVNGPEKRYYALSEVGIGKLQVAIFVNVLVVLLCAGVTTLFMVGAVPENRLRLVIFSQVLAMLISALMGCQLMLDAFIALFKGKFTVNSLLTVAFFVCLADSYYCLQELRVPCCAAFCLAMTMALWARYERHTTEMARMDTMRKAVRLNGIVRQEDYCNGKAGLLRTDAEVEDFMDTY